jgi:hypothetical protein
MTQRGWDRQAVADQLRAHVSDERVIDAILADIDALPRDLVDDELGDRVVQVVRQRIEAHLAEMHARIAATKSCIECLMDYRGRPTPEC